ncbi:efflux RND transporter periplasmic adaptor subunit [Legionella cardiaca]|uniref:Efflux RND transporter periplasmic adaptor subunit n=1 Tax=Legionella cardiaca TaxID=1071983 RepID=A0ABY8ASA6_9GAMM|nr:efflux RND transporter periplasmic adaptor subunit [Legionella cardiaca]WED43349.1 efflux RND transporter periplasmic adaptor subunit [Legionella cardiaca]
MNKVVPRVCYLMLSITLLISCGENGNNQSAAQARPVKVIQIGNFKSFDSRSFPGRAKASQEVDLSFNVSGSLIELPIKVGDKVKKGDLIAKLDPREFEAKLKSAQAEATRDKQNYLRAQELVGKGHISKSDYDLVESKWTISQANLDLAEKALVDSVIKAPFDGQIANLHVENYQTISAQQNIARLLNISQIEMVIQVPENAISLVPEAKNITVQFDAFPDQLIPAKIKEISNEASPDTRTYPVTLIMQQPKNIEILPGMAGKVKGKIEKNSHNKLTVPASAVLTMGTNNKTYVWVLNPTTKKVHRQQIQIGELTSTGISVLSGLTSGDWVVIAGIHSLKEGEAVTILNQEDN